jgi:hypothetical protein
VKETIMPVKLDDPPGRATEVLVEGMRGLVAAPSRPRAFRGLSTAEVALPRPLPLYVSTLQAAVEGRVLEEAQPAGWQYLILEGDAPAALAEVGTSREGGDFEFSNLARSSFSRQMGPGIERAVQVGAEFPEELSLRVLRISALYTVAVWLHGETLDRLIPLPPANSLLEPFRIYAGEEFTELLQAAGRQQREQPTAP